MLRQFILFVADKLNVDPGSAALAIFFYGFIAVMCLFW